MVKKEFLAHLLIGQDNFSKDRIFSRLKQDYLKKETEQFNLDVLYARELNLLALQEKLLALPFKSPKRILCIKNCQDLKEEVKDYLVSYVKKPAAQVILVLEAEEFSPKDGFLIQIMKYSLVNRLGLRQHLDTFGLNRQLELKKTASSLRFLNQLLENGEKPERILGGLRYAWEKDITNPLEKRRRFKLLLNCDIDIKTGRLKPVLALERLVVNLCGLKNPSG